MSTVAMFSVFAVDRFFAIKLIFTWTPTYKALKAPPLHTCPHPSQYMYFNDQNTPQLLHNLNGGSHPTPSLNTPLFHFYPSLFSSPPSSTKTSTMMSCFEPVQYQFTPEEIHELQSLFQTDSTSGSGPVYSMEERKRRRMLSNRESARRSRQRKKRNLEKLNGQLNHLKVENRELKNRLSLIQQQFYYVFSETDQLLSEYMDLQIKLAGLSEILVAMHAVQLNPTHLN